ncbi:MAG: peptide chain release factor N(5)-glutamine methyltransferase [Candidatus Cloacimonadaceae bacterium]|jgi:release factor glutamine methyltransferase
MDYSLKDYYRSCRVRIWEAGIPESALRLLFCEKLDCGLAELALLMRDKQLSRDWVRAFEELFKRLIQGEPVQYILGRAWFWGLKLKVSPDVLIPRPETEQLLELALRYCDDDDRVLDCCTGSGAIALALKIQRPDAEVHASDISAAALQIARENASDLQVELTFHQCDLFPDNGLGYDLIVSNPPYVSQAEYEDLEAVVKDNEPASALISGEEGLDHIRRILELAPSHLADEGILCLEHGEKQQQQIIREAVAKGWEVEFAGQDLAQKDRFLVLKYNHHQ